MYFFLLLLLGLAQLTAMNRNDRNVSSPAIVLGNQIMKVLTPIPKLEMNTTEFSAIENLLQNYVPDSASMLWWDSICRPFLSKDQIYSRIQVFHVPGKLNLLVLCWNKDSKSMIHTHGGVDSQCFIRGIRGHLIEKVFELPPPNSSGAPVAFQTTRHIKAGSVSYMNDAIGMHEIYSAEFSITLHAYIPGYTQCYAMNDSHSDTVHLHDVRLQAQWSEEKGYLLTGDDFAPNFECNYVQD